MLLVLASGICWFFLGLYMNKVCRLFVSLFSIGHQARLWCFWRSLFLLTTKVCSLLSCSSCRFCKNIPAPYTYEQYRDAHKDNLNLDNVYDVDFWLIPSPMWSLSLRTSTLQMACIWLISQRHSLQNQVSAITCSSFHREWQTYSARSSLLPYFVYRWLSSYHSPSYNNHINVLLGHNGAGKSTLISILTGLYAPTDGDAFLNGSSLVYNKNDIRSVLGVCPQQNVLLNLLTVFPCTLIHPIGWRAPYTLR